jgi:hypothetical protein
VTGERRSKHNQSPLGEKTMWNKGKFLLLASMPLALASCGLFGDDTSYYSVKIINECNSSKSVYIDGTFQNTISSGRSLTITGVEEGTHTLQASGLEPLRVYFDQDKVWTLCP